MCFFLLNVVVFELKIRYKFMEFNLELIIILLCKFAVLQICFLRFLLFHIVLMVFNRNFIRNFL